MLYCSKSRRESLKGPLNCDTVRCNRRHMCIIKVQGCHWDRKCKQQLARCISEKEYYEGAASCAGFECPSGKRCILREILCVNPPCKLIRSCEDEEDIQTWFDKCRSLNCASEYECFLRRPENNCRDQWCTHTPDCTLTVEDELISKYCYGWICPRSQKCVVRIVDSCKGFNCTIERSCRASSVSSTTRNTTNNEVSKQSTTRRTLMQAERELIQQELQKRTNYPIISKQSTVPVTSTRRQTIHYTTSTILKMIILQSKLNANTFLLHLTCVSLYRKQGTEVSLSHQQITTMKSNLITESSTNEHSTLPYPRFRLNYDKPVAINDGKVFQGSSSPATELADGKTEPTISYDTDKLETPRKIYITTNDEFPLPMILKDINFFDQGYPIWIKNDPYRSWEAKDEDGWRYHAPQEPYKILLPPYEPVILVEDMGKRGQFLPFFTDAFFTDLFNEAASIPLPEITPADIGNSRTDSTSTIADKTVDYTNSSTIAKQENIKTNHTDESPNDHRSFPMTEETSTASLNIRDKEKLDNYDDYEWRPWFHDYLERNEPRSSREQESNVADVAIDNLCKNDSRRNKSIATFSPPASTRQSDYVQHSRDEKFHGLANYPYDTIYPSPKPYVPRAHTLLRKVSTPLRSLTENRTLSRRRLRKSCYFTASPSVFLPPHRVVSDIRYLLSYERTENELGFNQIRQSKLLSYSEPFGVAASRFTSNHYVIDETLMFLFQMSCNCPLTTSAGPTLASTCGGPSFMLFMGLLEVFLRSQCDLEDPCNRPAPPSTVNTRYDFVVIGGGSAGATVAARLSEESRFSVLLLEAGLDEPTGTQIPSFFFNFIGSEIDWQYTTESEDEACLNKEHKKCYWPRGKVLGGTSVMNGMMYMRGSRKDYDDWAKLGNVGWSYRDVLPFFIRSEDNQQVNSMDYGYHGVGGPLTVMQFPYHPPLSFSLLEAGKELGYDAVDLNGRTHTGFAIAQTTSRNGSRLSTARAFLRPARNRPNLHIMLNSTATRILFDENNRAVGVEFLHDGMTKHVSVAKEVVVSGGAVNSPQILLNSGIGPREDLNAVGVPVVRDLPGVGKNLHNHVAYALTFTINDTDTTPLNWATAMEYLLFRDGLMSGTGISEVTAMINTKYADPREDHPDVQLIFGGYLADCAETGMVGERKGANRSIYIIPTILHPKSRGYLRLRNNDPLSKPLIYPKYLTHPDDSAALVEAVKFSIQLTETQALKRYGFELDRTPVKNCEHLKFGCDAYWECAIRHDTAPENHQAGSCKMGPSDDPMAVVDNQLRVRGVRGIRVADTSIMPRVTSGNTNAPAIMIGT
ncbi:Glucose dehydrogenase [acceptor] [Cyphomyrmex costatus]|uniref:Glucose dehydrogenase [acceptor] n=1 Tax=Cyphomyrmex costatus TaxID=456900 RepID=A0A151IHR1_9HYME|nr:Glucose dehydrogenase [acceptor] [Cyphomyrmex costatus]